MVEPQTNSELDAMRRELAGLDAAAAAHEQEAARRQELRIRVAEIQRRRCHERRLEAIRILDTLERQWISEALGARNRNLDADQLLRSVFGDAVADRTQPDPHVVIGRVSALLSELAGFASEHASVIDEACGVSTAARWRGDQMALGGKIRALRGRNPMAGPRTAVAFSQDVVDLLAIARGEGVPHDCEG